MSTGTALPWLNNHCRVMFFDSRTPSLCWRGTVCESARACELTFNRVLKPMVLSRRFELRTGVLEQDVAGVLIYAVLLNQYMLFVQMLS